jgi:hypothetical protein
MPKVVVDQLKVVEIYKKKTGIFRLLLLELLKILYELTAIGEARERVVPGLIGELPFNGFTLRDIGTNPHQVPAAGNELLHTNILVKPAGSAIVELDLVLLLEAWHARLKGLDRVDISLVAPLSRAGIKESAFQRLAFCDGKREPRKRRMRCDKAQVPVEAGVSFGIKKGGSGDSTGVLG